MRFVLGVENARCRKGTYMSQQEVRETVLELGRGRHLRIYDTGTRGADTLAVFWHHGTPNIGRPPEPLFAAAALLGVRRVLYDRPGYGGSSPAPGRDVASAARYTAAVVGALGIREFAGMANPAPLQAAAAGRAAEERYEADPQYDPEVFTPADQTALSGTWSWFEQVVGPATAEGPGGLIGDDLAYVAPWGFELEEVAAPVLLLHGGEDRMVPASHGRWPGSRLSAAALRLYPDEGHISVLTFGDAALAWLRERADAR